MKKKDRGWRGCRYGDCAHEAFDYKELLLVDYEDDYSGHVEIAGLLNDGRYFHYYWSYGSCSGCDTWEAYGYSYGQIIAEMKEQAVYFEDRETFDRYLAQLGRCNEGTY